MGIQFKAADSTARAKSIALKQAKEAETKAALISAKVETAAQRRDRFLNLVASKAAFYNKRHAQNVRHARESLLMDARTTVVKLESKQAAAEYLRELDLRLRQSKASLTVERAANVVERQRLSDHVSPMIGAARIRAEQFMASERRAENITDIAARAHGFVRRAVLTCALNEVRAKEQAEAMRANLEERLAAAAERKEDLLASNVNAMAGGGPSPSPERKSPAGRPRSAFGAARSPGGTVFRPPSSSPGYLLAKAPVKGPRRYHGTSGSGGDGCFSVPTSPIGA